MINFTTSNFIRKGPIKFAVLFKNIGTSYYEPQGTIKISNIFNKEISILEVPNRVVLPQGSRSIETNWNVKYLFGKYVAKISLTDGEGKIHTAVTSFWVFPWLEILLIIIGVVLLFALFRLAKKKLKFRNPFVLKE